MSNALMMIFLGSFLPELLELLSVVPAEAMMNIEWLAGLNQMELLQGLQGQVLKVLKVFV